MKLHIVPFFLVSALVSYATWGVEVGPGATKNLLSYDLKYGTTITDIRKLAEGVTLGSLSFQQEKSCIKPLKSPPDRLLKRVYKVHEVANLSGQTGELERYIHHIDLNGDGICDWLREGGEPHITDAISGDPRNFLFLGKANGWRYSGLTADAKKRFDEAMRLFKYRTDGLIYKSPKASDYAGFYETLTAFVYEKNNTKPFVVTYQVMEDRVTHIDVSEYRTFRWNSEIDNFDYVPLKQHAAILLFLQNEFCGKDPTKVIPGRDVSRFSSPSYGDTTLCKKADLSIKK